MSIKDPIANARHTHEHARALVGVARLVTVVVLAGVWFWVYSSLSRRGAADPQLTYFTPPREWLPWTFAPGWAIIYVLGGMAVPLIPVLTHLTSPYFKRLLTAYGLGAVVAFAVYACWPTGIRRIDYSEATIGHALMRWVVSMDGVANCFPSSHVFFATAAAALVTARASPRWLTLGTWVAAALVAVSTIAVGQHYFIDVAGGATLGVIAVAVANRLCPS